MRGAAAGEFRTINPATGEIIKPTYRMCDYCGKYEKLAVLYQPIYYNKGPTKNLCLNVRTVTEFL